MWDLATGTPIGDPFTGHTGDWVRGGGGGAGRPPGGHLRQQRPDGAGLGPGHRHPDRRTRFTGHDRPGVRGGGGGAGRPPGGHLRQRRRDGAGLGPGHRHPDRRPVHRPHRLGERGGGGGAGRAARSSSPAATTGRCGSGTWPPAPRSATRSPATPGTCSRWRPRSWTAARWSSPAATTRRCGSGTWPPAPPSAPASPATPTRCMRWRSAELDGRPVVISGSSDGTVRVWDLATGTPVGEPFTGHARVRASRWRPRSWTAARSSSPAATTRRCGSGTWPPAPRSATRSPATAGTCIAVAAAELDGRPVVISGSGDRTVRVWDLATGDPDRRTVHRPRRLRARGGGGGAGRPPGGHLRQQRPDGAGLGPGHRHPDRRPVHRPRPVR